MRAHDRPPVGAAADAARPRHAAPVDGGAVPAPVPSRSWPSYAAAAVAFVFAAVSFYWGAGGRLGLSTLGGSIQEMALARDPVIVTLVWVTGVGKVAGGVLALALVRPWGRRLPRRLLLLAAWSGAALLTTYGVLQVASVAAVALGIITPSQPLPTTVLRWRLLLWEPWFLLWGILLGWAAWSTASTSGDEPSPGLRGHGRRS